MSCEWSVDDLGQRKASFFEATANCAADDSCAGVADREAPDAFIGRNHQPNLMTLVEKAGSAIVNYSQRGWKMQRILTQEAQEHQLAPGHPTTQMT